MDVGVESNRGTHLTQSTDVNLGGDVEREEPDSTLSRPPMAQSITMPNLAHDKPMREPPSLTMKESGVGGWPTPPMIHSPDSNQERDHYEPRGTESRKPLSAS